MTQLFEPAKVRMIAMFTCTARSLVEKLDSMATPYSVNAGDRFTRPCARRQEVGGKAFDMAPHGLIARVRFDLVQLGAIAIQHHSPAAQNDDAFDDSGGE